jgi:hypothetical protein
MKPRDYDEMNFDERQIQIRGKIYRRGFIAFVIVLMLDAMLYGFGIVWFEGFMKNILLVMFVSTIVSAELHFRGVMYGKQVEHKLLGFICQGLFLQTGKFRRIAQNFP